MQESSNPKGTLILLGLMSLVVLIWQTTHREKLVVYCAHDSTFAESILRQFERKTGIPISIVYDTEATKSLGLVERIQKEAKEPRCDVFWNNEPLGTQELAEQGLLEPYQGKGWARIPEAFRDREGRWTGFAARMRVVIQRKDTPSITPDETTENLSRFAIAKPLYGTTLTHYSLLWKLRGADQVQNWHRLTREHGLREVTGNAGVKQLVSEGGADAGWTDTDDYFEALDSGAPVTADPVRLENGHTICIPNTVAIIKGSPLGFDAQQLVDFLLSAETELALAKSKSRQIPLGPVDTQQLPVEVRALQPAAAEGEPLTDLLTARRECLTWLKTIYVQ